VVEFHGVSPVVKATEYGPKTTPSTRFPSGGVQAKNVFQYKDLIGKTNARGGIAHIWPGA
jgi:hypothetical protein